MEGNESGVWISYAVLQAEAKNNPIHATHPAWVSLNPIVSNNQMDGADDGHSCLALVVSFSTAWN